MTSFDQLPFSTHPDIDPEVGPPMHRLRICFVSTPWLAVGPSRGGIPKSVLELSRALAREHEVHIVCPRPVTGDPPLENPNLHFHYAAVHEVPVYPIPDRLGLNVAGLRLLTRMVFSIAAIIAVYAGLHREKRFDVTYVVSKYVATPLFLIFRVRDRGAFVYSERNIWPWLFAKPIDGWSRFRFLANLWLGKLACLLSDAVHANSDSLRDAMTSHGLRSSAIAAIPNGIDVGVEKTEPEMLSEPARVAFVGRLVEDKGVRILVEAIRRVGASGRQVQFAVFGDGPLRGLFSGSGVEECRLMGERPREEVLRALRSTHISLFLSTVENVPSHALLEALAMGKAVIATRVGDTPRFLSDGENAVLCDPDPDSVVRAIATISDDSQLYVRITTGAQLLAAAYSWDRIAARHLALYSSALRGPEV